MNLFVPKSTLDTQMPETAHFTSLCKWIIRASVPIPQDELAGFVKFFRGKDRLKTSKMFFTKFDNFFFANYTAFHSAPPTLYLLNRPPRDILSQRAEQSQIKLSAIARAASSALLAHSPRVGKSCSEMTSPLSASFTVTWTAHSSPGTPHNT